MSAFDIVESYLVDKPHPLIGAETIQILLIREVLDYTVLRTEETRDLNTVVTPLSTTEQEPVRRVAFLASKQKAPESRELEHMLRSARHDFKIEADECYLKDNLCMKCPRCGLFGATNTRPGAGRANIKHRIEYSTAFSLLPFDEIAQSHTFNAINDSNQSVGQALGSRHSVAPASLFPSVVTLRSVTRRELILTLKTLLSCKSYGAESRIGGDIRNHIVGIVAGWEEVITALEFSLELFKQQQDISPAAVQALITADYRPLASHRSKVQVLKAEQVEALVEECRTTELDGAFIRAAYADITAYRRVQEA